MRILHVARPEDETTSYVDLITVGAEQDGMAHGIFSWKKATKLEFDVLHIHWPERMVRGRTPVHRFAKRLATRVLLARMGRKGLPVVRTLHNIAPHERGPRGEERLLRRIDSATTTFVALNRWTPIPEANAATSAIIPHPHYRGFHPTDPAARGTPGRILCFGLIRDYKGIDALLDAFASLDDSRVSLRIVGSATQRWRSVVEHAAELDGRVSARLEYVSDDDLATELQQAQAVVFPYQKMHNSGATFAALSQGRPVLIPANQVNSDLVREVGEQWAMTFEGEISSDDLRRLLSLGGPRAFHDGVLSKNREPRAVSLAYVHAYREALRKGRT